MINSLPSYQQPAGQLLLPHQPPMTNALPPYQSPAGQQPLPYRQPLRQRYTPEQVYLYFFPFPDRGPKIRELQQKIWLLYKQIGALFSGGLILVTLFLGSSKQGITNLGLLELAGILGIGVLIYRLVKTKLLPLREELRQEIAADEREKEYTRTIQPPNEYKYDEWINAISNDIYDQAPERLHLHEHPDHIIWRKVVNSESYAQRPAEPEKFGASLCLEGWIARSDEADEQPPLLEKRTRNSPRVRHYSVYVFTALFITEDYVAIYTSTVNLRDSTRDREEFEYCYHQHLSHMSLNVDTTRDIDPQSQRPIAFQESSLLLTFDSGRTIRRNISTLHVGNQSITSIDNIHEKLTRALIDHERSTIRSMNEANSLE
jgi:hypothetical protein